MQSKRNSPMPKIGDYVSGYLLASDAPIPDSALDLRTGIFIDNGEIGAAVETSQGIYLCDPDSLMPMNEANLPQTEQLLASRVRTRLNQRKRPGKLRTGKTNASKAQVIRLHRDNKRK